MNEIDRLRMERRNLEVEIKRLEEKVNKLKEDKISVEKRINQILQSDKEDSGFKASLFG